MPSFSERWASIVQHCGLDLAKPINLVNTSDIEKYGGWETRKMVSIGSERRQPELFRRYGVFVTPLSRTKVAIVRGKGFEKIEEITTPPRRHKTAFAFPASLASSKGEAGFLNYAFSCGLVGEFTKRPNLRSGFATKKRAYFTFRVDGYGPLSVEGAQIEVDASFEDNEWFYLTEAKYRTPHSINIRQLYYPFKTFLGEMKPRETRNLLFAYEPTPQEYRFWEYRFKDADDYEQIDLVKSARYKIDYSRRARPLQEYSVSPVPMRAIQANDVYKLMDLPFLVADGIDDAHRLAIHFAFDERQSSYYEDGMMILGFIAERGNKYVLTSVGEQYIKLPVEQRTKFFLRKLAEYPPVNEVIQRILGGEVVGDRELQEITANYDPTIRKSTIPRRAQSLRSYFRFFADVTGYCKVENGKIARFNPKETLNAYR